MEKSYWIYRDEVNRLGRKQLLNSKEWEGEGKPCYARGLLQVHGKCPCPHPKLFDTNHGRTAPAMKDGRQARAQAPTEMQQHGEGRGCMDWASSMVETQTPDEGHVHALLLFK